MPSNLLEQVFMQKGKAKRKRLVMSYITLADDCNYRYMYINTFAMLVLVELILYYHFIFSYSDFRH